MLPLDVEIARFAGKGAETITRCLAAKLGTLEVAVAVWFLNELFPKDELVQSYPASMDEHALALAKVLKAFPCRIAVVGGSASTWKAPPRI